LIAADVSLLAYAVNRNAPEHRRAAGVLEGLMNDDAPWALPWPVVHEFIRLVTHSHLVARPLRVADAWTFVQELFESPSLHLLAPTDRHVRVLGEVIGFVGSEPGLPPGIETAVVLREHGVRDLLSSDRGMQRFRFLNVRDPVHGPLWRPGQPPARRYRRLTAPRDSG
jgi:toxin-antitoxin system PIN domain toxin